MPKISELNSQTVVNNTDLFVIADVVANESKSVTVNVLKDVFATDISGKLDKTGGIITGDITLNTITCESINSVQSAKAFANFNGVPTTGTYVQLDMIITVTINSHGMAVGDICHLDFTSGLAIDKYNFIVSTIIDINTFTVIANNSTNTSGSVIRQVWIRNSYNIDNIQKVIYNRYLITFKNTMSDNKYIVTGSGNWTWGYGQAASVYVPLTANNVYITKTVSSVLIDVCDQDTASDSSSLNASDINVLIFGR